MRDLTAPKKGLNIQILSPRAVAWNARTDRHRILGIRSRKEEPELNFIECDCGWRDMPEEFAQHRTDVLKQRREEAQRALVEVR